jgi:hypothetical protein
MMTFLSVFRSVSPFISMLCSLMRLFLLGFAFTGLLEL